MEQSRPLIKKISTNFSTIHESSPSHSGRSSPHLMLRNTDRLRPMSPTVSRNHLHVKKSLAASARALDFTKRSASPFDQRPSTSNTLETRSQSSLSNRSAQPIATNLKGAENTVVSVRVRPAESGTIHRPWIYDSEENVIKSSAGVLGPPLDFSFDHVYSETSSNESVYETSVKKLVRGVIDGFHGTVFAYGMTGTGKTYSMQGVSGSPGIIPQAVQDIFRLVQQDVLNRYSLRVSYLEIYNEKIRDLLNGSLEDTEEIKIREDPKRGIHAYPLIEVPINCLDDFLDLMAQGDALRHSAATDFNAHSSRSHAVVQVIVEATPAAMDVQLARVGGTAKISTLNLIDLAGSEKAASDAERRKEGSYINKSLLTLGTVIARLTSSQGAGTLQHVPFRDSKLTRLLQHALSGLSLVSILATINTDPRFVMETTNTLKFASRAKFIPGKARKAEPFGGDTGLLIESLRAEIGLLRVQLTDSQALVAKLQILKSTGIRSLSESTSELSESGLNNIHEDEAGTAAMASKIAVLERERSEANEYIRKLQAQLTWSHQGIEPQGLSAKTTIGLSPQSRTQPSNFSHPSNRTLHNLMVVDPGTPSRFFANVHDETNDKLNSLADKELATDVLTKSQRSREEARTLQIQIAQLKKREDKKMAFGGKLNLLNRSPSSLIDEKENSSDMKMRTISQLHHTLVSPTLRTPREGFI